MAREFSLVRAYAVGVFMLAVGAAVAFCGVYFAFVLNDADAYGEVPVPGAARLHLPAGEWDVTFRSDVIGRDEKVVPSLWLDVEGSDGSPQPEVVKAPRRIDEVDNDPVVRVWVVRVAQDADYAVETGGDVEDASSPRLAFGRNLWDDWLGLLLGAGGLVGTVVSVSALSVIIAAVRHQLAERRRRTSPYLPASDAVQQEQLKNIAALRDSGAMTEKEYEAEKRRIGRG